MAKGNQTADKTKRRRKGAKMEDNSPNQNNKDKNKKNSNKSNSSNRTDIENNNDEPEVLVVPNSSSDSQNEDGDGEDEVIQVDDSEEDDNGDDAAEEEEEEEAKSSGVTNQRSNKAKNGDEKEKEEVTKESKNKNGKSKKKESGVSNCFPINRISRIIKSQDPDIRITQEAVFLVNKASDKFLELFCKEVYACAFLDRKNQVWYNHLSSVVSEQRRFDFLSDFVPEKVKAEDALAEMSITET